MMKHLYCIIIMLTVMPITSAFGLIIFDPENWGGQPTVANVLGMALFGLLSVPLWITFIPSLVAAPLIMNNISASKLFHTMPIWKCIAIAVIAGAFTGILILSPSIYLSRESLKLILNWAWSGALSGATTFTIIALIYREPKIA